MQYNLTLPFSDETVMKLKAGDRVLLSGEIYVARDAAHERIVETVKNGDLPPFNIDNATVFYAGPAPTKPGEAIGVIGPTTSGRMDAYTPFMLKCGLRAMIGKGQRNDAVIAAMKQRKAVYFGATGGTAVILSKAVLKSEIIAYEELGPEAILRLQVKDMPLVVVIDCLGDSLYNIGQNHAREIISNGK